MANQHLPLSDVLESIRIKTRQLVGRYGFTDREDLEQALLLRVLEKWQQYDPLRARPNTYLDRVIDSEIATLIEHQKRQRRDYRRHGGSFDPAKHDPGTNGHDHADLGLDIEEVAVKLPQDLRQFYEQIKVLSIAELARLARTRGQFRGMLKQLRERFRKAGLKIYLNR